MIQKKFLNKLVPKSIGQIDWLALILVLVVGLAMGWLSIVRYQAYNVTMSDLGNMAQPIWSVTQGEPLMVTSIYGNISRLAVHVELIYFALAPLYALWPDPRTLLIVQSLLFALGALPAYRLGWSASHNRWVARAVALLYLLYPGAQSAVLFDFHGDTLAMPLLLFALDALERRAWRSYTLWIILALLCKEYVAAPVFALGLLLLPAPATRRVGWWTILGAAVYGIFAFFVIRTLFAPPETYASVGTTTGYLKYYFSWQEGGLSRLTTRLLFALILFLPVLPVVRRAPLKLLPGLIIAGASFFSNGPVAFDLRSHHFALLVPFLVWSYAAGAAILWQRSQRQSPESAPRLPLVVGVSLFVTFLISLSLLNMRINWEILARGEPIDWSLRNARDSLRDRWLTNVPPTVPLGVTNFLAPHLLNRQLVYTLLIYKQAKEPQVQFQQITNQIDIAVVDALSDYSSFLNGHKPISHDYETISLLLEDGRFALVNAQDGLLLLKKDASTSEQLSQRFTILPTETTDILQAQFSDLIGLRRAEITPLGGRRYQLHCDWLALQPTGEQPNFVAVSRLKGVPHSRIAHLPTIILLPTSEWPIGQVIREEFEFEVAAEVPEGEYELLLGWYDTSSPEAWLTDEKSRLGEEIQLMTFTVP